MFTSEFFKRVNYRFFLLFSSLILFFLSVIGPPDVKIHSLVLSLNIEQLKNLYLTSDQFIRMPDTTNRIITFLFGLILLIWSSFVENGVKDNCNDYYDKIVKILLSLFLFSILSTNNAYNIIAIILVFISIYFYIFHCKLNLERLEKYYLISFILFFSFPFIHSNFISTSIQEVDNYTRFLIIIPIYLIIRQIRIEKEFFLYLVNASAIILAPLSILLFFDTDFRIRGYTSTATIYGNISIIFFLLTFVSIYYFKKYNYTYLVIPYIASLSALLSWGLSGSRSSILPVLFILILMLFFKNTRKYLTPLFSRLGFSFLLFLLLIFISSNSYQRFLNISDGITSVDSKSIHHWASEDSIIPRLIIWDGSVEIIKNNYLLGVGLDNFNKSLDEQIKLKNIQPVRQDLKNPTAGLNHAHNQYLDIFVKTGVFGLGILIIFIYINYYFFIEQIKRKDDNIYAIFGLIVIMSYSLFMINHAVFSHHQSTIFMLFLLTLFAGLSRVNCHEDDV